VLRSIHDDTARARVETAVEDIDGAIHQLREAIFGLHAIPSGVQLGEAIAALAADKVEALGFQPVVEVGPLPDDLPDPLWHEALQVVNEGLSNVIKHARATTAIVEVEVDDDCLVVTVTDNGVGPSVVRRPTDGQHGGDDTPSMTGHGVNNMAGRAADLNGQFHIGPGPGGGTRIDWRVPLSVSQS
jgi:signal transduction histidine kinase